MKDSREFAEKGFRFFSGAAAVDLGDASGVFAILTFTDTVLSDTASACLFAGGTYSGDEALLGETIPAGTLLYIRLTKLTIASGSGIAYLI